MGFSGIVLYCIAGALHTDKRDGQNRKKGCRRAAREASHLVCLTKKGRPSGEVYTFSFISPPVVRGNAFHDEPMTINNGRHIQSEENHVDDDAANRGAIRLLRAYLRTLDVLRTTVSRNKAAFLLPEWHASAQQSWCMSCLGGAIDCALIAASKSTWTAQCANRMAHFMACTVRLWLGRRSVAYLLRLHSKYAFRDASPALACPSCHQHDSLSDGGAPVVSLHSPQKQCHSVCRHHDLDFLEAAPLKERRLRAAQRGCARTVGPLGRKCVFPAVERPCGKSHSDG